MRDYYYCKTCNKRFFKVKTALEHKIATGHKIYHRFGDWPEREAFVGVERGEHASPAHKAEKAGRWLSRERERRAPT